MNRYIQTNFAPGWEGKPRSRIPDEYIRRHVENMERTVGMMIASGRTTDDDLAKALRTHTAIFWVHHPEEPLRKQLADAMFERGLLGRQHKG
jgi:hypothetical protein